MRGRPVLITGAARGIGRAVAFELTSVGAQVFLVARGTEALEATRRALKERWPDRRVGCFSADVTDPDAVRVAVESWADYRLKGWFSRDGASGHRPQDRQGPALTAG